MAFRVFEWKWKMYIKAYRWTTIGNYERTNGRQTNTRYTPSITIKERVCRTYSRGLGLKI